MNILSIKLGVEVSFVLVGLIINGFGKFASIKLRKESAHGILSNFRRLMLKSPLSMTNLFSRPILLRTVSRYFRKPEESLQGCLYATPIKVFFPLGL